jgi:hypothetical protein
MTAFVAARIEFLLFVHGLAFLALAWLAFAFWRTGDRRMPWTWLALFGLGFGLGEWVDLFATAFQQPLPLRLARLGLLAASFLCLLEFDRVGLPMVGGPTLRRRLVWPLVALAMLGAVSGTLAGVDATCRYALGLPAGLAAAWLIWQTAASGRGRERLALGIAAAALAAHALCVGIIVPEAAFFPASTVNQTAFFIAVNVPVELLFAACAFVATGGLWLSIGRKEAGTAWKGRLRRWSFPAVTALLLLLGWAVTEQRARPLEASLREALAAQTQSTGDTLQHPSQDGENAGLVLRQEGGEVALERPKSDLRILAVIGVVVAILLTVSFLAYSAGSTPPIGPRRKPPQSPADFHKRLPRR